MILELQVLSNLKQEKHTSCGREIQIGLHNGMKLPPSTDSGILAFFILQLCHVQHVALWATMLICTMGRTRAWRTTREEFLKD